MSDIIETTYTIKIDNYVCTDVPKKAFEAFEYLGKLNSDKNKEIERLKAANEWEESHIMKLLREAFEDGQESGSFSEKYYLIELGLDIEDFVIETIKKENTK